MAEASAGTLLIIDDEPSVRRSLQRLLRGEGYRIHQAADTTEARRILEAEIVDVVVCDQDMPGQSGTAFLLEVADKYPQQRRFMLSGRFQSDDVAVAIDAGAVHRFMMKPWDDAILKADIRAAFRQLIADWRGADVGSGPAPQSSTQVQRYFKEQRLSRELHEAASNGSLWLAYQAQVDVQSSTVAGFEALLRWQASTGPVRPDEFIDLAERNGAMAKLSQWVATTACDQLATWRQRWPAARIALNFSPTDLGSDAMIAHLAETIERYALPAEAIEVEITESQMVDTTATVVDRLHALKALGVELAIDDFGAGATSIAYLDQLPFSRIKLDRSLVSRTDTAEGLAVFTKLIELARSLGLATTVEGVESREQADICTELGAGLIQGYYFSRPLQHAAIDTWIDAGTRGLPA